jgi:hypothetical protein
VDLVVQFAAATGEGHEECTNSALRPVCTQVESALRPVCTQVELPDCNQPRAKSKAQVQVMRGRRPPPRRPDVRLAFLLCRPLGTPRITTWFRMDDPRISISSLIRAFTVRRSLSLGARHGRLKPIRPRL